ncbi:DEAD/DEAH box helicase [Candidatus Uhrbacteria bacterium]|nr:DEAD/DEAH box helicase [Candidatus Uhrbacteria bacterium]
MGQTTQLPPGFYGLGIAPKMLDILWKLKFKTPTPIQQKSIPIAIEGKDIIGVAQTGTGKTLAFGIPLIQRLAQAKGRGLVILPTRELALQADEVFQQVGRQIGLRTAVLIGGASMGMQIQMIRKNPHVLIVTPGRLIDHLEQKTVNLSDVKILVLDEADRMLDMGFAPQIKRILQTVPKDRQTMLFSATMPSEILKIASTYMKLPVQIEIARSGTTAEKVTQELYVVKKDDKSRLLDKILSENRGSVLVFTRTKHGATKIARTIRNMGHTSAEIHSNRSLNQRREALDGFKSGKYRVLVATDIAARGLDVKDIELVVNFDLPSQAEDYVHRIGRTGRAGRPGRAISIATPDQRKEVQEIERLTRSYLPVTKLPELPAPRPLMAEQPQPFRPSGGRGQSRPGSQSRRPSSGGRPPRHFGRRR